MSTFRPLLKNLLEKSRVLNGLSISEKEDYIDALEGELLQEIAKVVIAESSQEDVDRLMRALREGQEVPDLPLAIKEKVFQRVLLASFLELVTPRLFCCQTLT